MSVHADVEVAVLAAPWRAVDRRLEEWIHTPGLFGRKRVHRAAGIADHVACRRNALCRWFLDETDAAWLLQIDDDMVPVTHAAAAQLGVEPTIALAESAADVACCRAAARSGHQAHPHGLTAACLLVSRRALEAIEPPWFRFAYDRQHTRVEECECSYFARRVRKTRTRRRLSWLAERQVGNVGHAAADGRVLVVAADGRTLAIADEDWRGISVG